MKILLVYPEFPETFWSFKHALEFYYERVLTFLREYQPHTIRVHWDLQYLLAFWRSIYQLGIRGVERIQ